mmetsp:Transcript_13267/g.36431  ORF Transcript_13267/g.36431 Transcript_13267/m.36431 type:complete len:217 (+) Transcript_13267:662-1312(+)
MAHPQTCLPSTRMATSCSAMTSTSSTKSSSPTPSGRWRSSGARTPSRGGRSSRSGRGASGCSRSTPTDAWRWRSPSSTSSTATCTVSSEGTPWTLTSGSLRCRPRRRRRWPPGRRLPPRSTTSPQTGTVTSSRSGRTGPRRTSTTTSWRPTTCPSRTTSSCGTLSSRSSRASAGWTTGIEGTAGPRARRGAAWDRAFATMSRRRRARACPIGSRSG